MGSAYLLAASSIPKHFSVQPFELKCFEIMDCSSSLPQGRNTHLFYDAQYHQRSVRLIMNGLQILLVCKQTIP